MLEKLAKPQRAYIVMTYDLGGTNLIFNFFFFIIIFLNFKFFYIVMMYDLGGKK